MIYNVKLILIVYTSENVWPTVNQEGEYILNAVKAYGFFLWDFFYYPVRLLIVKQWCVK